MSARGLREGPRCAAVHRQGQLRFALGSVNGGVGAAVEHAVGPVLKHRGPAGGGIGQIEGQQVSGGITAAAGGDQLHPDRHLLAQGLAQLAGGAGEQDGHVGVSSIGVSSERSSR